MDYTESAGVVKALLKFIVIESGIELCPIGKSIILLPVEGKGWKVWEEATPFLIYWAINPGQPILTPKPRPGVKSEHDKVAHRKTNGRGGVG